MRWSTIPIAAFAWLAATGCAGPSLQGDVDASTLGPNATVSVGVFYDGLTPYGHWIERAPYGWCWSPDGVDATWRPYVDGTWVFTDLGWTWVANEPWGWACYHYGRWFDDPVYGWLWVPGTVWAPAWVAWRESDDWVGWAPLPPDASWDAWSGLHFEAATIPTTSWCFVERSRLADAAPRVMSVARNGTLIARTRDATRFEARDGRPVDAGIDVSAFERETGRRVSRLRIVDVAGPQRGRSTGGGTVAFFRPRVEGEPGAMPAPRAIEHPDPRPLSELQRERDSQRRRLENALSAERAKLEREHRRELQARREADSPETIRGRQESERRAFEQYGAQKRQRFEEQWNRKLASRPPDQSAGKAEPDRHKGKERNGRRGG